VLAHPAAMRVIPFAIFIAFVALSSLVHYIAPQQDPWDSRWLNVLRAVAVTLALACFWRGYGELGAFGEVKPYQWLLAISSGLAVFLVWIHVDHDWALIDHARSFDPTGRNGGIELTVASLRLAEFALVVPVMEELFWRSFLLRWLDAKDFSAVDPRRVSPRAFALTAALFALEHSHWFAGLVAGLLYNWVYMRTGNLWVPIASHAITNAALGIWIITTGNWQLW
jgi:CAAX prenyl protease-like protein